MSSWLRLIFYCTETEISSKNAEQVQYRVNRLPQASSFFQVCLQFQFFLYPKAFKIQTHWGESGFSRVLLWRAVTTRLWPGHQQQQQQLYLYPTVYRNIGEEYRLPQITIGAKEKWQPYLGDLSLIIWVRYHTHSHKHSPAKNAWLVDARPRDIAKFKMAAIPPSFVFSSGNKINCGSIWVSSAYTDFFAQLRLFIILFHLFLWDSFPTMLAFWPFYQIQLWTSLV